MDDTNTQIDVEALRADLIARTDEISLNSALISQMAKSDIDKIESSSTDLKEEEVDADEEAIAEIEAYADEQLTQFDAQLEDAIKVMEAEDIAEEAAESAVVDVEDEG